MHNEDGLIDYNVKARNIGWYNIDQYKYLRVMERFTGRDNILIIKLEEIEEKQSEIYKFLDIDEIKLKFPKKNAGISFNPNIQELRDKVEIIKWTDEFFNKTIKQISDEQIELIHERYNIA